MLMNSCDDGLINFTSNANALAVAPCPFDKTCSGGKVRGVNVRKHQTLNKLILRFRYDSSAVVSQNTSVWCSWEFGWMGHCIFCNMMIGCSQVLQSQFPSFDPILIV